MARPSVERSSLRRPSRWQLPPPPPPAFRAHFGHLPPPIVQVLYRRAPNPQAAEAFLSPQPPAASDPFQLPDMERAVERLLQALERKERIAIYGDYDVDGVSGTALLVEALQGRGVAVVPYIPQRSDGYGFQRAALRDLRNQGVTLVLSVDTGITAVSEIAYAQEIGLDVVITDHHRPPAKLPRAVAAINPRRSDSRYPFLDLAGVGVAYKLLQALSYARPQALPDSEGGLDLVALGTVADLAPLVGENRWLVSQGLERLRQTKRPGLRALAERARFRLDSITTETIAFGLAPRLNAAGRLDDARLSYRLLTTDEDEEAHELAGKLEELNRERQRLTRELVTDAQAQAAAQQEEALLWVGGAHYPPGVIGLVAGRLAEEHYRAVVALTIGEEQATASLRSIPELDLVPGLERCADLLIRFGGHAQAAGFTASVAQLPEVRRRLTSWARETLGGPAPAPPLTVDAEVPLEAWSGSLMSWLVRLEPFGVGNPVPLFLARDLEVLEAQAVGRAQDHLRLRVRNAQGNWSLIGFGQGSLLKELPSRADLLYYWTRDEAMGQPVLGLALKEFFPTAQGSGQLSLL